MCPPNVVFFGGNGSGGTGNAIINTVGEILGVQIITPGNYDSPPLDRVPRCLRQWVMVAVVMVLMMVIR